MKKRKVKRAVTKRSKVKKPVAVKRKLVAPEPVAAEADAPLAKQPTTAELLATAPIQIDRSGWARRGHVEYHPNLVLTLEIGDDLDDAAERMDEWALTTPGRITEVQLVKRRGKTVVYGRITL